MMTSASAAKGRSRWLLYWTGVPALLLAATMGCGSQTAQQTTAAAEGEEPADRSSQLSELSEAMDDAAEGIDSTDAELSQFRNAAAEIATKAGRSITPSEYGEVMLACMQEGGFDGAQLTPDGEGLEALFENDAEREGYNLLLAACEARYPVGEKYTRPLRNAQLRVLYDHFTGELLDCVRANGYDVAAPPPVGEFLATYESGTAWDPLNDTLASLRDTAEIEQLQSSCEHLPADLY